MSIEPFRIITFLILSLVIVLSFFYTLKGESDRRNSDDQPKYKPFIQGYMLPVYILILFAFVSLSRGGRSTVQWMISIFLGVFISISIYYVLLMVALPFMRKYINARTCAMMWLLPNYLYFLMYGDYNLPEPSFIIHAPENLVQIVFSIWLIGFLGILIWKIIGHLRFRRQILKDAVVVSNEEMLNLLQQEILYARLKKSDFELVISPSAVTPLSVGLLQLTTVIVLPERNYSEDELTLIFRHEIIHISRSDAWLKFFMTFCTAMCWFNPLMWMAMRKSADDMELSCDETVLLDSDEDTRRRYAKLILFTAGDERGFTTCLSASASALRYRLKNIITPKKRFMGALMIGIAFFVLCISCGHIALAYEGGTGAEILYHSENFEQYSLMEVTIGNDPYDRIYEAADEKSFHEYMASLPMNELVGEYDHIVDVYRFRIVYDTPNGLIMLNLYDEWIQIITSYDLSLSSSEYYLPEGVDWEYLNSLLVERQ